MADLNNMSSIAKGIRSLAKTSGKITETFRDLPRKDIGT